MEIVANINLRDRLIKVHKIRRRRLAAQYLKERVAKIANSDISAVTIDPALNRILETKVSKRMEAFKVSIEKGDTGIKIKPFVEQKKTEHADSNATNSKKVKESKDKQ
ncbi:MAG: hypothetical protein ACP5RF_01695 [Candidatus Micrarchaeia archaeon]